MLKTELTGYSAAPETQEKNGVFTPVFPRKFLGKGGLKARF
jgi:hypothetical protein